MVLLWDKKLEVFSFRGALPPDPLTRGSAPGPRWGSAPVTGSVNIDTNDFLTRSYLSTTRGNSMKLFKPQITSVRDGKFFANRVISHWNSLSNSFVLSPSVASFKCKLQSLNFHL